MRSGRFGMSFVHSSKGIKCSQIPSKGATNSDGSIFDRCTEHALLKDDLDSEQRELANLRCSGEQTEVIVQRHKNKSRNSDYPGLAFGTSVFSSNTMMKLSVIKNELHNIMAVQLKRLESEVASLDQRRERLGQILVDSEHQLNVATNSVREMSSKLHRQSNSLFEVMLSGDEDHRDTEDRFKCLRVQLLEIQLIAEQADREYHKLRTNITAFHDNDSVACPAEVSPPTTHALT